MRNVLTIKGMVLIAVVSAVMAAAAIFAAQQIFDVNITANVRLGISAEDPLQILSGDGQTPIGSGDIIDFGTAEVDFWGTGPVPVRKVFVRNTSNTPERVIVTGDGGDGILPLFGFTEDDLKPWPDNGFDLAASGDSGDTVMGWLGLRFLNLTSGSKSTTIIFRAVATTGGGPVAIEPPAGMVAWWPGDGNAQDIVGNNDGTLVGGATYTGGMVGRAFSFDGGGDFVDISSGPDLGNRSFSVDMWIRYEDPGPVIWQTFFAWGATALGTPSEAGFQVYLDNGQIVGNVRDEDGNIGILFVKGLAPAPKVFHHVALVLDREDGRIELYINGTQAAFDNIPGGFGSIGNNVRPSIGALGRGGVGTPAESYNGLVDEVTIYNRALTAEEIKDIYDAGSAGKRKP